MNTVSPTKLFENATDDRIIQIDSQRSYDVGRRVLILPDNIEVQFTPSLAKVYQILLNHPGYLMSRDEILDLYEHDKQYDHDYELIEDRTIDRYVCSIRKQLKSLVWSPIVGITGGYMANIDFDDPKPDERVDLADDAYFDKRNGRVCREGYEYEQLATVPRNIFQYLLKNPERLVFKAKLMESVAKDFNNVAKPETAEKHIERIRVALKRLDLPATDIIETVRGQGYRFNPKARTLW
jgi:DNA-binding response OmpR family regulator